MFCLVSHYARTCQDLQEKMGGAVAEGWPAGNGRCDVAQGTRYRVQLLRRWRAKCRRLFSFVCKRAFCGQVGEAGTIRSGRAKVLPAGVRASCKGCCANRCPFYARCFRRRIASVKSRFQRLFRVGKSAWGDCPKLALKLRRRREKVSRTFRRHGPDVGISDSLQNRPSSGVKKIAATGHATFERWRFALRSR
jgi:hypothetical protein